MTRSNFSTSVTGTYFVYPKSIRLLSICIVVTICYCLVITVFMLHYLYNVSPKHSCASDFGCNNNRTLNWKTSAEYVDLTTRFESGYESSTSTESSEDIISLLDNITDIENTNRSGLCPDYKPDMNAQRRVNSMLAELTDHVILSDYPDLLLGGHWKPSNCIARHKVAIIIPYRDRKRQLKSLIHYLIPMLKSQLLDFRFILTEQLGDGLFNKGRIMNAAFTVAEKMRVHCVIFHDVDMVPEDDRLPYTCPDQPRHLGAYVNVLRYELWYDYLLGGVVAIKMDQYKNVNGHSNSFWGWGGEDDDLGKRVLANNMTIDRMPIEISKYTMMRHMKRKYAVRDNIKQLLNDTETRWPYDGLNMTEWKIVSLIPKPLYFHLYVDVGEPPKAWKPRKTN